MRHRRPTGRTAGFTLIEMLLSMVLTLVVLSTVYGALVTYRRLYFDSTQRVEIEQGLRGAYEFFLRDIESAGFRLINNGRLAQFGTVFANTDASDTVTTDSITIWTNPETAEATLTQDMAAVDDTLRVDGVTGFAANQRIWIVGFCTDGEIRRDSFIVSQVDTAVPLALHHDTPENPSTDLVCRFRTGAKVALVQEVTYSLSAPAPDGQMDLLRQVNDGPQNVITGGLTGLTFSYFDAGDPAAAVTPNNAANRRQIRKVRVQIDGQTAEVLRGSGLARDVTFTGEVAPRNLVLQRNL